MDLIKKFVQDKIRTFRERFQDYGDANNPRGVWIEAESGLLEDYLQDCMLKAYRFGVKKGSVIKHTSIDTEKIKAINFKMNVPVFKCSCGQIAIDSPYNRIQSKIKHNK